MAAEIRRQAEPLHRAFKDPQRVTVTSSDGAAEGKEDAAHHLDRFIQRHFQDISRRLRTQLALDRQLADARDRRVAVPLPAVTINGVAVQVEAQIQYRAGEGLSPERIFDPEIRYSFKIPNVDLWKSGNITTGRGLIESTFRKINELSDDAAHREKVAETKRRQIAELTGLQNRIFTHGDELMQQRRRLEAVNAELERSSAKADTSSVPANDDTPEGVQDFASVAAAAS
jgi:hypothetical protein